MRHFMLKGEYMDDDLMYKLYNYIEILQYYPDTQTSRGAIASELELILDTKFRSKKARELYEKLLKGRMKNNTSK